MKTWPLLKSIAWNISVWSAKSAPTRQKSYVIMFWTYVRLWLFIIIYLASSYPSIMVYTSCVWSIPRMCNSAIISTSFT